MKALLSIALLLLSFTMQAQENRSWTEVPATSLKEDAFTNRYKPQAYRLFHLDEAALKQRLASSETTGRAGALVSIPNEEGTLQRFIVSPMTTMEPGLASRYPGIRSYEGRGIDDPTATILLDMSPRGFHAMILSSTRKTVYIDPIGNNHENYLVFSRKDVVDYRRTFQCMTTDVAVNGKQFNAPENLAGADDGRLRTFRLALACTGEYAQYFLNGTETTDAQRKTKVLAAMNTLLTRTNGIYERDFGIHMNLIANNDLIIYLDPSTDPWTTEWNTKTQQTIDAVIGSANYDIGHLVHKESTAANNNGNAGCIGCVCKAGQKGSGFTSHVTPEGDPFVVDYTTHEMGHQFGANHTFTFSNETGTASQMEPGSGTTIMGYAGITGSNTDVQPHSDDYFHARSVEQVTAYIKSGTGGGACAVVTVTGNATPTANAGASYTIPKSTPFALTGAGTDADAADVLTYTWEQTNTGTSTTTIPSATATSGPVFRSRYNGINPTRNFPILASILDGTNGNKWEVLPSVARTLNFRLVVRDNHVGGGNNNTANMTVTISSASGPFSVIAPNTAVTWAGGSTQTITWNVASSNLTPVSCANVKISLSTDGGQTFPTVLAASTPNDGSEALVIPATPSSTARIKIEAVGNIFFDISNTNFTIGGPVGCTNPGGLTGTSITSSSATLSWTAVSGALSYDVDYKTNASGTWINAATATASTSVNLGGLAASTLYDWRVRTNCSGSSSSYSTAQFTTSAAASCGTVTGLASSAVTQSSASISWTALSGANNYDVDYKANSSGTWINAATGTTSTSISLSGLTAATLYDWRVRANCTGATGAYSSAQFTTSATSSCSTAFEPNETQAAAATISAGVANSAAISSGTDVDYYKVVTTATSNNTFSLAGPSGVDYDLYVYNSAGTQIGSSEGTTATETVSLTSQAAGTYYIKVVGYNGANSATCYTITATTSVITGCQSSYDNSTNGTTAGAASIPFNTNITGLISPTGDVDNYKFVISTGGTITLTLSTLPADYDLKLLNSAGTQVGISQNGSTTSETINYTAAAGTYYAQVYGYNGANSASSCYTLKVQLGTASKQATAIAETAKLSVYPNPAKNMVNVSLLGLVAKQTRLQVTDARGVVVMEESMTGNIKSINVSRLPAGVYMIRANNGIETLVSKFVKE